MIKLTADEIRESYLKFFESKEHLRLPSYSLVPVNDPTLLLIGAGMAPLKPYFKGEAKPPRERITTCQKCIRVGDIEQVGRTSRHLTFFEMLGNFSFGNYFKRETIKWAWEYMTEVLQIPKEIIYISVHTDDDEAEEIWNKEVGVPIEKISRMADNFWGPIGDTGPCGPCSELYVDQGAEIGCGSPDCKPGCDCDRYLEVWNLVFTGLNKNEDGKYETLPKPCIDTGLGFERLVAYMHGKSSNFDTELFEGIIGKISEISGKRYGKDKAVDVSIRVVSDHIRSVVFMASDGITPSNEGRGYVMRRLLRRSVRLSGELGFGERSLTELVDPVINRFGYIYPELKERKDYTISIIKTEEHNFRQTLAQGMGMLENILAELDKSGKKIIPGNEAFNLYDTYGFPIESTKEIAAERGYAVDMESYEKALEEQRNRARADSKTKLDQIAGEIDLSGYKSEFTGYETICQTTNVLALFKDGKPVVSVGKGESADMVVAKTCFYGESGGQVGDTGIFKTSFGAIGKVTDTRKTAAGVNLHKVHVDSGELRVGEEINLEVTGERRDSIKRHHTATHLLQSALRQILGGHVMQMGSLVEEGRLRFDFSHHAALTEEEIVNIEITVNKFILENHPVKVEELGINDALKKGALAFFGEKYGDRVRVVTIEGVSTELCGGTHVSRTGDIGMFKITSETAIGMGTRRIEAVCGLAALSRFQTEDRALKDIALALNSEVAGIPDALLRIRENTKKLEKELKTTKSKLMKASVQEFACEAKKIGEVDLVVRRLDEIERDDLRVIADTIADALKSGVIVLGALIDGKVSILVRLTDDLVKHGLSSVPIIKEVSAVVGGGGGGNPRMSQAGGKDPSKLDEALSTAPDVVRKHIEMMRVTK